MSFRLSDFITAAMQDCADEPDSVDTEITPVGRGHFPAGESIRAGSAVPAPDNTGGDAAPAVQQKNAVERFQ
jgi:hypothetical protein